MDFELSDDQTALVDGMRSLLAGRFSIEAVRALEHSGGIDRGRWRELAETGVFSLALAEADGGVGLGWIDAVLVFEELGRSLVPGPLVSTTVAAGLVEGAASGEVLVGVIERPKGTDPVYLEYPAAIDTLLVLDAEGVWQVDPAALDLHHIHKPLDILTPAARAASLPQGDKIADAATAVVLRSRGAVLTSAIQLGLAAGACELATAYAKERQQFGKPIGQFQAIKHICADMVGRVEVLRAAVYMAGLCLDDAEIEDPVRAASMARIIANNASSENGKDCVQVHGGMGYTWEVDAHLFLKRAWALSSSFGTSDDHAEAMATYV
jgi:alkylation response protein AidB-like acyl-CoA dehydrogenase